VIVAERLSRDFGRTHALEGVSLRVGRGETVALLGPNGAGKSTLLQILAGVLRADDGRAEVAGLRIPGDEGRLGERVGFVPQGENVYPELTVRENVRLFGSLHLAKDLDARADSLIEELALRERADDRAGSLSGGLRQRVAIAASLVHDPPVLLLDEPATGLDPLARDRLLVSLRALGGRGRTVLFTTHNLEDAARLADRVVLIARGKVAGEMPPGDIAALRAAFVRLEGVA
jgi:ABC-2 type transport system ATP-binding protein